MFADGFTHWMNILLVAAAPFLVGAAVLAVSRLIFRIGRLRSWLAGIVRSVALPAAGLAAFATFALLLPTLGLANLRHQALWHLAIVISVAAITWLALATLTAVEA